MLLAGLLPMATASLQGQSHVYLLGVPDYNWSFGCFGTACGNLIGYWDRHGLPDLYQGSVSNGVAPLNMINGITAMWASQAGVAGRPANEPGHVDDYWIGYGSEAPDPYVTAGRVEHEPDCINDFTGVNQRKWTDMNGECDGNLDGYGFVYWESNGLRRTNYAPYDRQGGAVRDIPSGLRNFARFRGYSADVFSQYPDFHPDCRVGAGFTFEDLKAEIDAGYPVLLFLQDFHVPFRLGGESAHINPEIHGMLAYGYREDPALGVRWVYYRTSWAGGDGVRSPWSPVAWQAQLPVRGILGFHPKPRLTRVSRQAGRIRLNWDGPASLVYDALQKATNAVHRYQVEQASSLGAGNWTALGESTSLLTASFPEPAVAAAFYRVVLEPR